MKTRFELTYDMFVNSFVTAAGSPTFTSSGFPQLDEYIANMSSRSKNSAPAAAYGLVWQDIQFFLNFWRQLEDARVKASRAISSQDTLTIDSVGLRAQTARDAQKNEDKIAAISHAKTFIMESLLRPYVDKILSTLEDADLEVAVQAFTKEKLLSEKNLLNVIRSLTERTPNSTALPLLTAIQASKSASEKKLPFDKTILKNIIKVAKPLITSEDVHAALVLARQYFQAALINPQSMDSISNLENVITYLSKAVARGKKKGMLKSYLDSLFEKDFSPDAKTINLIFSHCYPNSQGINCLSILLRNAKGPSAIDIELLTTFINTATLAHSDISKINSIFKILTDSALLNKLLNRPLEQSKLELLIKSIFSEKALTRVSPVAALKLFNALPDEYKASVYPALQPVLNAIFSAEALNITPAEIMDFFRLIPDAYKITAAQQIYSKVGVSRLSFENANQLYNQVRAGEEKRDSFLSNAIGLAILSENRFILNENKAALGKIINQTNIEEIADRNIEAKTSSALSLEDYEARRMIFEIALQNGILTGLDISKRLAWLKALNLSANDLAELFNKSSEDNLPILQKCLDNDFELINLLCTADKRLIIGNTQYYLNDKIATDVEWLKQASFNADQFAYLAQFMSENEYKKLISGSLEGFRSAAIITEFGLLHPSFFSDNKTEDDLDLFYLSETKITKTLSTEEKRAIIQLQQETELSKSEAAFSKFIKLADDGQIIYAIRELYAQYAKSKVGDADSDVEAKLVALYGLAINERPHLISLLTKSKFTNDCKNFLVSLWADGKVSTPVRREIVAYPASTGKRPKRSNKTLEAQPSGLLAYMALTNFLAELQELGGQENRSADYMPSINSAFLKRCLNILLIEKYNVDAILEKIINIDTSHFNAEATALHFRLLTALTDITILLQLPEAPGFLQKMDVSDDINPDEAKHSASFISKLGQKLKTGIFKVLGRKFSDEDLKRFTLADIIILNSITQFVEVVNFGDSDEPMSTIPEPDRIRIGQQLGEYILNGKSSHVQTIFNDITHGHKLAVVVLKYVSVERLNSLPKTQKALLLKHAKLFSFDLFDTREALKKLLAIATSEELLNIIEGMNARQKEKEQEIAAKEKASRDILGATELKDSSASTIALESKDSAPAGTVATLLLSEMLRSKFQDKLKGDNNDYVFLREAIESFKTADVLELIRTTALSKTELTLCLLASPKHIQHIPEDVLAKLIQELDLDLFTVDNSLLIQAFSTCMTTNRGLALKLMIKILNFGPNNKAISKMPEVFKDIKFDDFIILLTKISNSDYPVIKDNLAFMVLCKDSFFDTATLAKLTPLLGQINLLTLLATQSSDDIKRINKGVRLTLFNSEHAVFLLSNLTFEQLSAFVSGLDGETLETFIKESFTKEDFNEPDKKETVIRQLIALFLINPEAVFNFITDHPELATLFLTYLDMLKGFTPTDGNKVHLLNILKLLKTDEIKKIKDNKLVQKIIIKNGDGIVNFVDDASNYKGLFTLLLMDESFLKSKNAEFLIKVAKGAGKAGVDPEHYLAIIEKNPILTSYIRDYNNEFILSASAELITPYEKKIIALDTVSLKNGNLFTVDQYIKEFDRTENSTIQRQKALVIADMVANLILDKREAYASDILRILTRPSEQNKKLSLGQIFMNRLAAHPSHKNKDSALKRFLFVTTPSRQINEQRLALLKQVDFSKWSAKDILSHAKTHLQKQVRLSGLLGILWSPFYFVQSIIDVIAGNNKVTSLIKEANTSPMKPVETAKVAITSPVVAFLTPGDTLPVSEPTPVVETNTQNDVGTRTVSSKDNIQPSEDKVPVPERKFKKTS